MLRWLKKIYRLYMKGARENYYPLWRRILISTNDPVCHCRLYKKEGCSHVDGFLCDYPDCEMLHDYESQK